VSCVTNKLDHFTPKNVYYNSLFGLRSNQQSYLNYNTYHSSTFLFKFYLPALLLTRSSPNMAVYIFQMSGQLLGDCDTARLAALSYSRLPGGGLGSMYSATYPSTDQNPYPSITMENSFYGPLVSHFNSSKTIKFFIK